MLPYLDLLNCSLDLCIWSTETTAQVRICRFFLQKAGTLFVKDQIAFFMIRPEYGQQPAKLLAGWICTYRLSSVLGMWQPCFQSPNGRSQDGQFSCHVKTGGDYSAARDGAEN